MIKNVKHFDIFVRICCQKFELLHLQNNFFVNNAMFRANCAHFVLLEILYNCAQARNAIGYEVFTFVIIHIFKFAEARFQIDAFVKQFELSSSVAELCSIRFAKVGVLT